MYLAAGCSEGRLVTDDGPIPLRTALVSPSYADDRTFVLLSDGDFTCGLPGEDEPLAQEEAIRAIQTAACREGAHHLLLGLRHEGATPDAGTYPGGEDAPSVAATWIQVDETVLVEQSGLSRRYHVTAGELRTDAADGGEVVLDRSDEVHLKGRVDLPEVGVRGAFRAAWCGEDTGLIDLLETLSFLTCG